MKVGQAAVFVAIGIWIAYTYPDWSAQAFQYIDAAYNWIRLAFQQIFGAQPS